MKIAMTMTTGEDCIMGFHFTAWRIVKPGWLKILHCPSLQGKLYNEQIITVKEAELKFDERETKTPNYLGDDDLLEIMDQHKIGTQATQVEALAKMEERRPITKSWLRGRGIDLIKRVVTPTIHGIAMIATLRRVAREKEDCRLVGPEMRRHMWESIVRVGEGKCTMDDVIREESLNGLFLFFVLCSFKKK